MSEAIDPKNEDYTAPKYQLDGFNCPHCGSYNQQHWYLSSYHFQFDNCSGNRHDQWKITMARCNRCDEYSLWLADEARMIYPHESTAPRPNKDMPAEIKSDFNEARNIVSKSPRGAAALLRLATEKLAGILVERVDQDKGNSLNANIKILVEEGLPSSIQKALDSLRVIGNNAVHPGMLDLKDDRDTALKLFRLLNVIVENRISQVTEIDDIYKEKVPDSTKEAIEARDTQEGNAT